LEFTGERLVPDDPTHRDLYWEHAARYELAAQLAPGKRALDLGCGCGYGADRLARAGAVSVIGVDSSDEALAYAARYQHPQLRFIHGDARRTGLADGSLDLVVCFELIEHLAEQDDLLAEIRRLLAPDGIALISTPEASRPEKAPNPWHVRELGRAEFEALLHGRFGNVALLGQRRFSGLLFAASDAARLPSPSDHGARATPSYWIAICSDGALPALAGLIEIPYFQDLDELRTHLAARDGDVAARDQRIEALQREVAEKTVWGRALDERAAELERDVQDRDVRLVLLARERDAARATLGFRLHARLAPKLRRLAGALRGIGRGVFFSLG
jgi:SAM-dependent methyltransferase